MARAALGALALIICVALTVFLVSACDGELYYSVQLDEGVAVDDMRALDLRIAEYLAGDEHAIDGLFGERATEHMRDVYDIFARARLARNVSLIAGAVLLASAMNRDRLRRLAVGARYAIALFLLPFVAAAIWAAVDFEGAFEAMHRLLFDNDLYLLDSDELLIRMLPERFFINISGRLAVRCSLAAIAVPFATQGLSDASAIIKRVKK